MAITTDCIIWSKGRTPNGYGKFKQSGRTLLAHRWAWEQVHKAKKKAMSW